MGTPRKRPVRTKEAPPLPTPKRAKPWDPLPLPEKGDEDPSKTFEAVGRAISSWELLEAHLGLIFSVFVDSDLVVAGAMRAYGSVTSFSGRQEMLRAASVPHFLLYPNDALRTQVDDLLEAARQFSTRRNEIAHGIAQPYFVDGKDVGWAVVPSFFATRKRALKAGDVEDGPLILTSTPTYAYASEQLLHWLSHFRDLSTHALATYYAVAQSRQAGKALHHSNSLARHLISGGQKASETPDEHARPSKR